MRPGDDGDGDRPEAVHDTSESVLLAEARSAIAMKAGAAQQEEERRDLKGGREMVMRVEEVQEEGDSDCACARQVR
jgi:hypothetical protein